MATKTEKTGKTEKAEKSTEIVDFVVDVNRITKVTKGGKRFSFSAFVVSGDKQGNVGIALGKSREVAQAIAKAIEKLHMETFGEDQ